MRNILEIEKELVQKLKGVYDPEMPASVYDLGLIYDIEVSPDGLVEVTMTLTSPNCPLADDLVDDVKGAIESVEGVGEALVTITFDPPWDPSRMSDEARLELGFM